MALLHNHHPANGRQFQDRNLEHWVASERRDRSWDVSGCNKGHDGDHGKTAIVELRTLLLLQEFRIHAGKVDRGEDNSWKVTALGVVGSLGLSNDFRKENGEDDLRLACRVVLRNRQ